MGKNPALVEAADYYEKRVVDMLREEERLAALAEGPFKADVDKYRSTRGMLIHADAYGTLSIEQIREQQRQEEHEIAFGERIGKHVATLCFRHRIDAAILRKKLDELIGESPNLGRHGVNTTMYVLQAPKVFAPPEYRTGYGIVISARTNTFREMILEDIFREQIKDACSRLTCEYDDNELRQTRPGYLPDFIIPDLAKVLEKRGICLPRTG
jgi:hypothetical protein